MSDNLLAATESEIAALTEAITGMEATLADKRLALSRAQAARLALIPKPSCSSLKNKEGTLMAAILTALSGFPNGATSKQVGAAVVAAGFPDPGASLGPLLTVLKKRGDILRKGSLLFPVIAPTQEAAD